MSETAVESLEIFTEPWAAAWAVELRASATYREAAERWEGSLVLELEADPELGLDEDRGVYLDLHRGDCRGARLAGAGDRAAAAYVLGGPAAVWKRILEGELEPIWALMSGKLKLRQGSLAQLTSFVTASRELVAAATRIGSRFPDPRPPAGGGGR